LLILSRAHVCLLIPMQSSLLSLHGTGHMHAIYIYQISFPLGRAIVVRCRDWMQRTVFRRKQRVLQKGWVFCIGLSFDPSVPYLVHDLACPDDSITTWEWAGSATAMHKRVRAYVRAWPTVSRTEGVCEPFLFGIPMACRSIANISFGQLGSRMFIDWAQPNPPCLSRPSVWVAPCSISLTACRRP
jgi:hypothetical protein